MSENLSHDAALDCIVGAAGVTVLSYEEAIAAYFRLRGLGDPASTPPSRPQGEEGLRKALERIAELDKFGGYNSACGIARKALAALSNQGKPSS